MESAVFGTGSWWELALSYLFTVLLFGMFAAAMLVPLFWIISNLRDKWHELPVTKRIRIIASYAGVVLVLGLIAWRSAMPSNF